MCLDAYGKDVILIETVGAGQDEVDIAGAAQTTILVNTPNMGDEVQTLKAGHHGDRRCARREQIRFARREPHGLGTEGAALAQSRSRLGSSGGSHRCHTGRRDRETGRSLRRPTFEELESSGKMQTAELDRARQQIMSLARATILHRLNTEAGGRTARNAGQRRGFS